MQTVLFCYSVLYHRKAKLQPIPLVLLAHNDHVVHTRRGASSNRPFPNQEPVFIGKLHFKTIGS